MLQPNFISHSIMKFIIYFLFVHQKWSRVGAILLHFHFYSILEEKMEFYIGDALIMQIHIASGSWERSGSIFHSILRETEP